MSWKMLVFGLLSLLLVSSTPGVLTESFEDELLDSMASRVAATMKRHLRLPEATDDSLQKELLEELKPDLEELQSRFSNLTLSEVTRLKDRFTDEVLSLGGLKENELSPRFPFFLVGAAASVLGAVVAQAFLGCSCTCIQRC